MGFIGMGNMFTLTKQVKWINKSEMNTISLYICVHLHLHISSNLYVSLPVLYHFLSLILHVAPSQFTEIFLSLRLWLVT